MRRSAAKVREILPDVVYNDTVVTLVINIVMLKGKKATAEKIIYSALGIFQRKLKLQDSEVISAFKKAVDNARPSVEVKSRRVGGATYPVPVPIPDKKSLFRAVSSLVRAARSRSGAAMYDRFADELLDAFNNKGAAVKKKEDMHKMAEANKAFAQYSF